MKRYYLLFICLLCFGTVFSQVSVSPVTVPTTENPVDVPSVVPRLKGNASTVRPPMALSQQTRLGSDKLIYGWLMFVNIQGFTDWGLAAFHVEDPTDDWTVVKKMDDCPSAAAVVDGKMYAQMANVNLNIELKNFSSFDCQTWAQTVIRSTPQEVIFADMAYDYSTETMFAITTVNEDDRYFSRLLSVNLKNGDYTTVSNCDSVFSTLACDIKGNLYGVTAGTGYFCRIQKQTGEVYPIGYTGDNPGYTQSMDIDLTDGTCYWAAYSIKPAGGGYLATIDYETGKLTNHGSLAANAEVSGLWAPLPWDGHLAPAKVSDYTLSLSNSGSEASVTLNFTAPTSDGLGNQLASLARIEIYRDYELVHTISTVKPGDKCTWTDSELPANEDILGYRVVAVGKNGIGLSAIKALTVGEDIPGNPTSFVMNVMDDTVVELTWKAPEKGLNGGWINEENLRYEIIRYPDGKILANGYFQTCRLNDTITNVGYHWYSVRAYSEKGSSSAIECSGQKVGQWLALPYYCNFNNDYDSKIWVFEDYATPIPDGYGWVHNLSSYDKNGFLFAEPGPVKACNDWAYTSPIQLDPNVRYRVRYDYSSMSQYEGEESLQIVVNPASDRADTTILAYHQDFRHDYQTSRVLLPEGLDGAYEVAFGSLSKRKQMGIYLDNVKIDEAIDALVNVTVKNKDNEELEGAFLYVERVSDTLFETYTHFENGKYYYRDSLYTDSLGFASLRYLDKGDYKLAVSLFSYEKDTIDFTVEPLVDRQIDIVLDTIPTFTLTGKVSNSYGEPVAEARVNIQGYETYGTRTDADGNYTIKGLYRVSEPYSIAVFKNRYKTVTDTVLMKADRAKDVVLPYVIAPVSQVQATEKSSNMEVTWSQPQELVENRIDDGILAGAVKLTVDSAQGFFHEKAAFGVIYYVPMELKQVKWWMSSDNGSQSHEFVNITIWTVHPDSGFGKMLLHVEDVPNTDDTWSMYELERPLRITSGCVVLVGSTKGGLAVGVDAGTSKEYPFQLQRSAATTDWGNPGSFLPLEDWGIKQNLMVRAIGVPLAMAKDGSGDSGLDNYAVYRLHEGMEDSISSWTLLQEGLKTTAYTDSRWSELPMGAYRYAVTNDYNGVMSEASVSNVVGVDMFTQLTVNAKTNTEANEIEGALVTLTNRHFAHYNYQGTLDAQGKLVLDSVWKGEYDIRIYQTLFSEINEVLDLSEDNTYNTETYVLEEKIVDPYNLMVDNLPVFSEKRLRWNNDNILFDDFEDMPDFMINPPGELGWSYLDLDQSPTSFIQIGTQPYIWENITEPHAFIAMNVDATQPSLANALTVKSGSKFLMDMCYDASLTPVDKDDYIFSPMLEYSVPFVFSFWASSATSSYLETIEVGYSTTDTRPESFTMISGDIKVPGEWTSYSYNMPAEAKYVTIHVKSTEPMFFFLLDDVYIGPDPNGENPDNSRALHYEVYLDGDMVGTSEALSYTFTGLTEGTHKAGVVAVYETGKSSMVEKEFMVDSTLVGNESHYADQGKTSVYPNPVREDLYVNGTYTQVEILDMTGKCVLKAGYEVSVPLSGLRQGIYVVRLYTSRGVELHKIVKM